MKQLMNGMFMLNNKKWIYSTTLLFIVGCNEDIIHNVTDSKIIVSGQSNAVRCDWSYFEAIAGYEVVNIAIGGYTIQKLIDDAINNQYQNLPNKMVFVHGESDAKYSHDGDWYVGMVNDYINILGVSDVYISLVGYRIVDGMYGNADQQEMDLRFDEIRQATIEESKNNSVWNIGFSDAKYFRDWGLMSDHVHFNSDGCKMMMDSISKSIKPTHQ